MEGNTENNFRDFFKNNIDFLFVLDMQGNIIETNDAVHDILGYTREELTGKSVLLAHPPEFRDQAAEIVHKMLIGEESSCPIPLLSKQHEYIPVETRVYPGFWNSQEAIIGVSRNLTELKLSADKFSSVFNLSQVLMAITTRDTGVFIDVNEKYLSTLGYSREEIIGKPSGSLDIFCDYKQREEALEIFSREGRLEDFETIVRTKSGTLLTCLFSIKIIKIQTHEYLLTSAIDITRLKEAESKVNFLYNQQKLLADISLQFNSVQEIESILYDVLRILGEHTGVSRVYILEDKCNDLSEVVIHEWCNTGIVSKKMKAEIVPPDLVSSWRSILTNDRSVIAINIKDLPARKQEVFNQLGIKAFIIYPLFIQNIFYGFFGFDECVNDRNWTKEETDLFRAVSGIISNALERNKVLKNLEESRLRLKLTIKGANEGIWDWYNQTGYVYFNTTWCKMIGYERHEIEPHVSSWEKLVHPDDLPEVMEILEKHLKGETEFYESVHRLKTKEGSWKWILDHGMVVQRDADNQPLRTMGTHIDITGQKETEQKLQELLQMRDKLFSIISHDLRGPIGNQIEILEMITTHVDISEDEKREFLVELKNNSRTAYNLLNNLLSWSKSQTNTIILTPQKFFLRPVIEEIIGLMATYANQKSIKIVLEVEDEIFVFADLESINLVIRNLLSNAIKFTPDRGTVFISAIDRGVLTEIEIRDTGVGMNKKNLENLFTLQTTSSTRGTRNEKGSGLGLILCKDFVEKNGGSIHVESTEGKGSRFAISLPKNRRAS